MKATIEQIKERIANKETAYQIFDCFTGYDNYDESKKGFLGYLYILQDESGIVTDECIVVITHPELDSHTEIYYYNDIHTAQQEMTEMLYNIEQEYN